MIKTAADLIDEFPRSYAQPYHRLSLLKRKGEIFELKRGIYETDKNAEPLSLAGVIAGPSYISFETALSYYDLIPEQAKTYLSASFALRKKKTFSNAFGTFIYQDIPEKAYPFGTRFMEVKGRKFEIATPEKALCDTLCKIKPMKDVSELQEWLFSFMRMEEKEILALDSAGINGWTSFYAKKNIYLLASYLRGEKKHG
jgi:predicted transcriptional regulator of viral defense system